MKDQDYPCKFCIRPECKPKWRIEMQGRLLRRVCDNLVWVSLRTKGVSSEPTKC